MKLSAHGPTSHIKKPTITWVFLYLVGVRGFEPPTPSSRRKCATRLRYTPAARIISLSVLLSMHGNYVTIDRVWVFITQFASTFGTDGAFNAKVI